MSVAHTAQQILFQASLSDVVRRLRANKTKERETIEQCLAEIKSELQSTAQNVKVTAVVKLTYFSMLGFSGEYGAFNIIEVMADSLFHNKRVGYVAAAVCFHEETPILPLITALLKKDLLSPNHYEVGLALYCLSCVCTPDLARDLVSDVVALLSNPRSFIRKKAILCLYKIFLQFPEALRLTYPKLKEKIEDGTEKSDNDPAVRGAVVNVFCEMARRNPGNFLNLVVPFFNLLSTVHNNWTLIKIVKVFGYFAPHEPRLGKKLVEPITNLINTTSAKSVQYECIFAVANGMSKVPALIKLAVDKMKLFVEDRDQNLKYLGLDAMSKVMIENPKALLEERDTILCCLDDPDSTIRYKATEILKGMATRKNLVSTVNAMFDRVVREPPDEDWSNNAIKSIIETVQFDDYSRVQDFEWYCGLLLDIAQIPLSQFKHGELLEEEFITILTRVRAVRQFGVESLVTLLSNQLILSSNPDESQQWMVLKAAAFLCGEFPHWLPNKRLAVQDLLSEKLRVLPPSLQVICVAAVGKILSFVIAPCPRHLERQDGEEELEPPADPTTVEELRAVIFPPETDEKPLSGLMLYCHSLYPDVQEKAQFVHYLITNAPMEAAIFYAADLEAVAEGAQKAVPLPEGLDLSIPFTDMPSLMGESDDSDAESSDESSDEAEPAEAKIDAQRRKDKARRIDLDAFYIKSDEKEKKEPELPPIEKLEDVSPGTFKRPLRTGGTKAQTISRALAKPASYTGEPKVRPVSAAKEEDEATKRLKNIKVTGDIGTNEALPEIKPYVRIDPSASRDREESKEPSPPSVSAAFSIGECPHCQLCVNNLDCKAKKDLLHVSVSMTLTATDPKHSLYAPTLTFAPGPSEPPGRIWNADPATSSFAFAERVKAGTAISSEVHFTFASLPNLSEPLQLVLTYLRGKDERKLDCALPLKLQYFLKPIESIEVDEYNTKVLQSLSAAACLSAAVPFSRRKPASLLPALKQRLRLAVVEVLPDCVSLYGQLHGKKIGLPHIAVLLHVAEGEPTLTIYSKCNLQHVSEQVVQEIAEAAA